MNIGIDIQPLLSPGSKNRGIGNYNFDQLKLLFETDKENRYIIFNPYSDETIFELLGIDKKKNTNIIEFNIYTGKDQYLIQTKPHGVTKRYSDVFGDIVRKFLKEYEIDIFYFTSPFDYWDIFNMEWFNGVATVGTVYDIIPYIFPEKYLNHNVELKSCYMRSIEFIKKLDKILAISQSVKDDLIRYLEISEDKIDVIYAGIDSRYKILNTIDDEVAIRRKYNLKDKFIMCTGGADPRKNMNELVVAYSKLPDNLKKEYKLAIVCSLNKDAEKQIKETARTNKVYDRVVITNFIPFGHLLKLYNMASLMAFPSQYEGFGLPVVEAMACGTPVLTSNNSSLGEIAKTSAILVDPFNIESITNGMIEALNTLNSVELKNEREKCVSTYTWANTVGYTIDSLKRINLKRVSVTSERKRIAIFTPLPPQKSGISDYSYDIMNELVKYFDIDVFVDDNYNANIFDKNNNIIIYNHKEYISRKENFINTIYQVGNSSLHSYMFEYIKKYRGIVVLHDYNLFGIIEFLTSAKNDFKNYELLLSEDGDELAKKCVEYAKNGIRVPGVEANGFVTNYASKVIVHSDYAKKKLLEKNISTKVVTIPLYAKIEEVHNKIELRAKYKLSADEIIIASFGFIADTKRIDKAIEALSKISKREKVRYILVGEEANQNIKNMIKEICKKYNMENKVTITGFATMEEFDDYIHMCDICINLRYPYNGESSASLMKILAAGKPVMVSNIGSFSEIPDECCIKIPISKDPTDENEVKCLIKELDKLINDSEYRNRFAINAKEYAEKNLNINIVVKKYVENILNKEENNLTEELLKKITINEIKNLEDRNEEIFKISKALSYIV